ncbi:hypothetical protein Droror1_Dr00024161 [Drosera rotundifolia]
MSNEEWMLDYALQQAISKINPDEQRRVALLAQAFEKVNLDLAGTRTGVRANKATAANSDSSEDNVNGKKAQMHGIHYLDLKQDGNPVPCIMKNPMTRDQVEILEVMMLLLSRMRSIAAFSATIEDKGDAHNVSVVKKKIVRIRMPISVHSGDQKVQQDVALDISACKIYYSRKAGGSEGDEIEIHLIPDYAEQGPERSSSDSPQSRL